MPHTIASEEQERGIWYVGARHGLEIDAQVFDLSKLRHVEIDPRCRMSGLDKLVKSQAVLLNIDYPLGMAAYRMLREIMENLTQISGIYILGKAATLNGSIGDVMISNAVNDEHSQNTYWLDNCFTAAGHTSLPHLRLRSGQSESRLHPKARTCRIASTWISTTAPTTPWWKWRAAPTSTPSTKSHYLVRYPTGENINFAQLPYELGILHYASDTPYTRGKNLGAGSLSYFGMDSTYAGRIAILRRIFENEVGSNSQRGGEAVARAEALRIRRGAAPTGSTR